MYVTKTISKSTLIEFRAGPSIEQKLYKEIWVRLT